jgi:hypothetical protein
MAIRVVGGHDRVYISRRPFGSVSSAAMHLAQRSRTSSHPSAAAAPAPARERQAPAVAPLPRSGGDGARHDALGAVLARAVQRRATDGPLLQRAIIAIDGPTDKAAARKVTRRCLSNLTHTRDRGEAAGPTAVAKIVPPALERNESLYILGHGNTDIVADMDPPTLGDAILAWYGTDRYRGKIKLVACSSGIVPEGLGAESYAQRLSGYLAANATASFRPKSVDGVLGIAWVHETRGNIVALDEAKYDEHEKAGVDVEAAFTTRGRANRRNELERLFGAPDAPGSSTHTGRPGAKVRYYTNLPTHPPGTGWSLKRALGKLIPCIP